MENWHTVLNWGRLFSTVTNSSSTPMLTRPNFLRLPLSLTPLWIFNYTDKELRKPLLIPPLSEPDSQVEIPHLPNMGAAPVTVHLITLGPAQSPDATQHHSTHTHASAHTCVCTLGKLKWTFSPPMGEVEGGWWWWWGWWGCKRGWVVVWGGEKSCHFPTPH